MIKPIYTNIAFKLTNTKYKYVLHQLYCKSDLIYDNKKKGKQCLCLKEKHDALKQELGVTKSIQSFVLIVLIKLTVHYYIMLRVKKNRGGGG